jgi:hypothetical protein
MPPPPPAFIVSPAPQNAGYHAVLTYVSPTHKDVAKVTIDNEWEVTTTPKKNELSVLRIHAAHDPINGEQVKGTVIMSHVEGEWVCAWRDANGQPRLYNAANGPPPREIAAYIQKAYEAMEYLQNEHEIMNIDIHSFAKLYDLKTEAHAVIESAKQGGGTGRSGMKVEASLLPNQTPPETQIAGHLAKAPPAKAPPRLGA